MEHIFKDWHSKNVAIRFADIDKLGHVNNAKYLTYVETARIAYFLEVVGEQVNWNEQGIILAKAEINFAVPMELEDMEVMVFTSCTNIGSKSFQLSYVITKKDSRTICATGSTTMVCYNYNKAATIKVPDEWRTKLENN